MDIFNINSIQRRTTVTDDIFQELEGKYPPRSERNGITYAQNMRYFSLDEQDIDSAVFRQTVKDNCKTLVVYIFVRYLMGKNGWYIPWDETNKRDVQEKLSLWGVKEEEFFPLMESLLTAKMLYIVHKDGVEYLTDLQQIYNWEMLQEKRKREREKKQRTATRKNASLKDSTLQSATQSSQTPSAPHGFENADDDPFGFNVGF